MDIKQKIMAIALLAVMPLAIAAWDTTIPHASNTHWNAVGNAHGAPQRLLPVPIIDVALDRSKLFPNDDEAKASPVVYPIGLYTDTSQTTANRQSHSSSSNDLVAVGAEQVKRNSQYEEMEFKQTWAGAALLATRTVRF